MCCSKSIWFARLALIAAGVSFTFPHRADAQALPVVAADRSTQKPTEEGPSAALAFEKRFRRDNDAGKPVPLEECQNIRPLTENFWSKKQVLSDFEQCRTEGQIGAIVIVKTEYCCDDSRLCAVTTACMERKSTPLIGQFRIYAAWIKNSPDHQGGKRNQWDQAVIEEYGFNQGPGARIAVMVPKSDGKMAQWFSTASDLRLSSEDLDRNLGRTPELERFLAKAVKHAAGDVPDHSVTADAGSVPSEPEAQANRASGNLPRSRFGFRRTSR